LAAALESALPDDGPIGRPARRLLEAGRLRQQLERSRGPGRGRAASALRSWRAPGAQAPARRARGAASRQAQGGKNWSW